MFASCLHRDNKISYEQGIVISKHHEDAYTDVYSTMDMYYNGKETICCMPTVHTQYYPEINFITFKCQHQKIFRIDRRDLYNSLNEFDTVTIEFYNLLDKKNNIKDYDFITAYRQNKKNW